MRDATTSISAIQFFSQKFIFLFLLFTQPFTNFDKSTHHCTKVIHIAGTNSTMGCIRETTTSISAIQLFSQKFLFFFGDMLDRHSYCYSFFAFRAAASPLRLLDFVVTTSSGHPASSPHSRP
jgi:hypothetical protein